MSECPLQTVDEYRRLTVVSASRRYFYGAHASQFGDLFLPAAPGPHPVLILIHGGCWRAEYGLAPLGQLAQSLADRGVAVWNIEYRRLGDAGGWPATLLDAAAATDLLRTLAGAHALDLRRVVTAGHSAGGHLALWLAARHNLPAHSPLFALHPLPVRAVLSLAGIPDLAAAAAQQVCGDAVIELLGGSPAAVASHYADASPAALTPLGVPHLHVHGRADTIVPLALVAKFVAAAAQAGDRAEMVVLEDVGHFELVDAATAACNQVSTLLAGLFADQAD